MSTIEEAREQARETLADYHRVNLKGYGAGNHASLARALRALLDATEPQETTTPPAKSQLEAVTNAIEKVLDGQDALHCTRVWEAWGYGTMSEEDFSPVTNDAEAVNEIASAVLEALDATEPPARAEPAEDEREALVMTLYANGMAGNLHEPIRRQAVEKWADAILADGDSKGPRPVTDERPMSEKEAIWEETTKRLLELHGPVEIEPCETICGQCSFQLPNGAYFGKVEEWPCPTVRVLQSGAEARR